MKKNLIKLFVIGLVCMFTFVPLEGFSQMWSPYVAAREWFRKVCRMRIVYATYDPADGTPVIILKKTGTRTINGTDFYFSKEMPLVLDFGDGVFLSDPVTGEELYIPDSSDPFYNQPINYDALWQEVQLEVMLEEGAFV